MMTMPTKHELTREVLPRYLQADKPEKTRILDEFCANTGYARKYAIAKFSDFQRRTPAERELRPRTGRKTRYGPACLPPLKKIWEFLEYPCGERLQPYLPEILPKLEDAGFLHVRSDIRENLLTMSGRTIDRLLEDLRKVRRRRVQATTKPGTLLKPRDSRATRAVATRSPARICRARPRGPLRGDERRRVCLHAHEDGYRHRVDRAWGGPREEPAADGRPP